MILPKELYYQILYDLPLRDVLAFSHVSREIWIDELFWFNIFKREHSEFELDFEMPQRETWKESIFCLPKVKPGSSDFTDVTWEINKSLDNVIYEQKEYCGPIVLNLYHFYDFMFKPILINKPVVTKSDILHTIYDYYNRPLTRREIQFEFRGCRMERSLRKYDNGKCITRGHLIEKYFLEEIRYNKFSDHCDVIIVYKQN